MEIKEDFELFMHVTAASYLATGIGLEAGFAKNEIKDVAIASSVHDWGKLLIPRNILYKPGKLTEEEFEVVKLHPRYASDKLTDIPLECRKEIRCHHNFQKEPYPVAEKFTDHIMDKITQVIAVADQASAMLCSRCYRPPFDRDVVLAKIRNNFTGDRKYIELLEAVLSASMY